MTITKEAIEVMQAYIEGKTIEYCYRSPYNIHACIPQYRQWEVVKEPAWNWGDCEYRVKKEPLKFYIVKLCGGLYAFSDKDKALRFASHYTDVSLIEVVEV